MDQQTEFDHYPALEEFGQPIPGLTYYLIHNQNRSKAEREGLAAIQGLRVFQVTGPKGTADAVLMCSGEQIPAANVKDCTSELLVDDQLESETGLARSTEISSPELEAAKTALAGAKQHEQVEEEPTREVRRKPAPSPKS